MSAPGQQLLGTPTATLFLGLLPTANPGLPAPRVSTARRGAGWRAPRPHSRKPSCLCAFLQTLLVSAGQLQKPGLAGEGANAKATGCSAGPGRCVRPGTRAAVDTRLSHCMMMTGTAYEKEAGLSEVWRAVPSLPTLPVRFWARPRQWRPLRKDGCGPRASAWGSAMLGAGPRALRVCPHLVPAPSSELCVEDNRTLLDTAAQGAPTGSSPSSWPPRHAHVCTAAGTGCDDTDMPSSPSAPASLGSRLPEVQP